ncbi:MAG: class I SAM-dependent methyltransferase [Candidatus Sericytochromatia bacterium]
MAAYTALLEQARQLLHSGRPADALICLSQGLPLADAHHGPALRGQLAALICRSYEDVEIERLLGLDLGPVLQVLLEDPGIYHQDLLRAPLVYLFLHRTLAIEQALDLFETAAAAVAWQHPLIQGMLRWPLFRQLLSQSLLLDPLLERYLTRLRWAALELGLLQPALLQAPDVRAWLLALAGQAWNNEYVYSVSPAEKVWLEQLRTGMADAELYPLLGLLYAPLASWELAEGQLQLLGRLGPDWTRLRQIQGENLRLEAQLSQALPSLTPIADPVSRQVRDQYEANPYPRWLELPPTLPGRFTQDWQRRFPDSHSLAFGEPASLLVLGCGTGEEALVIARRYPDLQVLGMDLSRASLAYAWRMAQELQIGNIRFAQADLLEMGTLAQRWPVIVCSGVLHHLAEPWQAWQILASLLAPGGVMKVGLYSQSARQALQQARNWIRTQGWTADPDGIRACRQALLALPPEHALADIPAYADFYSLSACRDLLFHVQESAVTLVQIADFLAAQGLDFIGIEPSDRERSQLYRRHFGQGPEQLANWQRLEALHPDLFLDMYQFWCRKP